jgi:hypothetical protein
MFGRKPKNEPKIEEQKQLEEKIKQVTNQIVDILNKEGMRLIVEHNIIVVPQKKQ